MRFITTVLFISLIGFNLWAQSNENLPEAQGARLEFRYQALKNESQTYERNDQVYKVIKSSVLDAFWKTVKDSLQRQQQFLLKIQAKVDTLTKQKQATEEILNTQNASIQEVLFDSNHITVIGIPFTKGLFISLFVTLVGGLVFSFCVVFTRMKYAISMMNEKSRALEAVTSEFDQFKKKSLERQTKLSRQLQDERNKLHEERVKKMPEMKTYQ
jgi:uncharacterized membrane protein